MVGDRIIAWLRTPAATLIVLATALVAQLPHAADVFRLIVAGDGLLAQIHSYSYAVALELAVLLFVVQRRNAESYIFAVVSVCVNLAYYSLHNIALFSVAALPAWLISVALPAAIARYSHLIVDAAHSAQNVQAQATSGATPAQETQISAQPVQKKQRKNASVSKVAQRRQRIAQSNLTDAKVIAEKFGISLRTAQSDLVALRNGVRNEGANHHE